MPIQLKPAPKGRDVIRIGAYQGPTRPCALEENGRNTLRILAEAHRLGVDFACLPECFLSGYGTPKELRTSAIPVRGPWFQKWVCQCRFGDMVCVVGFMEQCGDQLFNSAAIIQRGRLLGAYHKSIPGSKHESKATTFVSHFPVYRARGIRFGVIICYEGSQVEPSLLLAERGARIIFEPHYSFVPMKVADYHLHRVRNHRIARAVENGVWYVKANTVTEPGCKLGKAVGLGYGDSFILDSVGRPRAEAGLFTTGWITTDVPRKELTGRHPSRLKLVPPATRKQVAKVYLTK